MAAITVRSPDPRLRTPAGIALRRIRRTTSGDASTAQTGWVVIVITGPIASGKSTVAGSLATELELRDVRAEVIDLDVVHDRLTEGGATTDESSWTLARQEAATAANAFLEAGVAVVIADGSFNLPIDREAFARHLRPGTALVYVTLRVSFEEALRRAQGDPTRGRSRDPQFLGAHFAERREVFASIPATDIVIDSERTTAAAAAATIASLVGLDRS
jgi:adenylylsulfate kinase-like enzyme